MNAKIPTTIPVVIFVYKRVENLEKLISSLLKNMESNQTDLIIFSDGPKDLTEAPKVEEVRDFVKRIQGFKSIRLEARDKNLGLANSFLTGVSEIFTTYDRAIFLEDDNLVSPNFLFFMNSALEKYELTLDVGCVTGFSFPVARIHRRPYFLLGAETWSFGTWRRVWDEFETDSLKLKTRLDLASKQNKMNMYGFNFYQMLEMQIKGEIDSWGVRWWANAVLNDLLCLYPATSYCINTGWGPEGTHFQNKSKMHSDFFRFREIKNLRWPHEVRASNLALLSLRLFNGLTALKGFLYQIGLSLRGKEL
jgi:glycosyltransferase involved in cell wall biosynthesis